MNQQTSDVSLVRASKAQAIKAYENVSSFWGEGLSTEDFVAAKKTLNSCKLNKENLTEWALLPSDDLDGLELLSHLETIKGVVYSNHKDNGFEKRPIYSIAAVFTPEQHRKQGYANTMIKKLIPILNSENSIGSVLYSSIGPYYERLGYRPYSPYHTSFSVNPNELPYFSKQISFLKEEDIKKLAQHDCELIENEIKSWDFSSKTHSQVFVIEPSFETYEAQWLKAKFFANLKGLEPPTVFGVSYKSTNDIDNFQFLVWTYDYTTNELYILRHRLSTKATELIEAALIHANLNGLSKVMAWNLDVAIFSESHIKPLAQVIKRDQEHLPYLHHSSLDLDQENCNWYEVQKYAFC